MKIRYAIFLCCISCCLFISNVFAVDLEIESGKKLQFGFVNEQGENSLYSIEHHNTGDVTITTYSYRVVDTKYTDYYDKNVVYDSVNIGAASKVDLANCWEYVFVSSETSVDFSEPREIVIYDTSTIPITSTTKLVQDEIHTTTYTYAKRERLATLSIASTGTIVLNNGSELAIRNEYSLITSAGDSSLKYDVDYGTVKEENVNVVDGSVLEYVDIDEKDKMILNGTAVNSILGSQAECFTGNIVFESGDTDTILTFKDISENIIEGEDNSIAVLSESEVDHILTDHLVGDRVPVAIDDIVIAQETESGGDKKYVDVVKMEEEASELTNVANMKNDFIINSKRAVFNVQGAFPIEEWSINDSNVCLSGKITGSGTLVKQGNGTLVISGDSTGLTGENTGYGWSLEQGMLVVSNQDNLGNSDIYINPEAVLGLLTESEEVEVYKNDILSNKGKISIASNSLIQLSGDIGGINGETGSVSFEFYKNSTLTLSGNNEFASDYSIIFSGNENYLISDVEGLASDSIIVTNSAKKDKEFTSFELNLNEDNDVEYSGSLQGEMYFRKTGNGNVILSGENTYTQGTYITEGGLLLANSNSIGTSKIMFDGGVRGDSTTYATIGVSSATEVVEMVNDIHVKNGAIFDVYDNQTFDLSGSIVNYDPKGKTEIIKTGLGNVKISGKADEIREINITTFTITSGSFILDNGVVLKSYFSLDGENACLKMNEGAGVTNNIDIYNGYLSIFNEANISSSVVNFSTTSSKLEISSDTYFTTEKFGENKVHVSTGMEFCILAGTTTAKGGVIDFQGGDNTSITKSGAGTFNLDPNTENFNLANIEVTDGMFAIEHSTITVSENVKVSSGGIFTIESSTITVAGETILDGGIFKIPENAYYDGELGQKITLLDGAVLGIYDENSINHDVLLSFEGENENNLSQLLIEKDNVELGNSIYVEKGLIISNENTLSFKGDKIEGNMAIFGKAGSGTMTIATDDGFVMGELRILDGTMQIETNVNVSTLTISGSSTTVNISSTTNIVMDVNDYFSISSSTLNLEENVLMNLKNADIKEATINLASTTINSTGLLNIADSKINSEDNLLMDLNDVSITSTTMNLIGATVNSTGLLSIADSEINLEDNLLMDLNDVSITSTTMNLTSATINSTGLLNIADSEINLEDNLLMDLNDVFITSTTMNLTSATIDATGLLSIADSEINLEGNSSIDLSDAYISGTMLNLNENTSINSNIVDIVGTTINLTSATFNAVGLNITDSEINLTNSQLALISSSSYSSISNNFVYKAPSQSVMNLIDTVLKIDTTSVVSATQINMSSSTIYGYGKINSSLNVNDNSTIYVGDKDDIAKLETESIVFGEDSNLYIDVKSEFGMASNDVLKVNGDVDVQKGSLLDVNIIGDYDRDFNLKTAFSFMEFDGNLTYTAESFSDIFDVNLSNARFSYKFILNGSNKLVLELSKEFGSYDMPGLTKNQTSMQNVLNTIYADPIKRENLEKIIQTLDVIYADYLSTGDRAPFLKSLRELSGINFINSIMSSALLSKTNMLYTRLSDYTQRKDNNIWAQAYTNSLSVSAVEENPKYENNIYGVIAGYDQQIDDNSVLGVSGFYGTGEFKQIDDKADVQDGGINIYGDYKVSDVEIKGTIGYASQNYDTTRKLTIFDSNIKSNYSVNVYTFDAQADYSYAVSDNFILKPFLGVNCNVVTTGNIEEKGNQQQRLFVKENNYTKADARVGLRFQSGVDDSRFNWYVSVLAKQILTGNQFTMKAHFVSLPSDEFEIESTKLNSTAFAGNIGCLYNVSEYVNLFLDLSADTSSNTNSYNGSIGASYRW